MQKDACMMYVVMDKNDHSIYLKSPIQVRTRGSSRWMIIAASNGSHPFRSHKIIRRLVDTDMNTSIMSLAVSAIAQHAVVESFEESRDRI